MKTATLCMLSALLMFGRCDSSFGQANSGELRLKVSDRAGLARGAFVLVTSEGTHYRRQFLTDGTGPVDCQHLDFGQYTVVVTRPDFAPLTLTIDVNSAIPLERSVLLQIAPVTTRVQVDAVNALVDRDLAGSVVQIGSQQIEDRVGSLPGRSVQDLVDAQPGWLYEGNAVLHPRGSEYQTQFVVDGVPLTDNRSPSFGPEIEADDLSSMSIYTAGFPAEYGRKLGGVVELNTRQDMNAGLHGQLVLSGGSYATAASFGNVQYAKGRNEYGVSASRSTTSHYLNPVVPENYTNTGTTGDFSGRYEGELSPADRLVLTVRHELSRFLIPNELVQQMAGQRQDGDNFETMATLSYQHTFSANSVANFASMGRSSSNDLGSNAASTPIVAFQQNYFNEAYFKGSASLHRGHQEFKAGFESDSLFLHETFNYQITDPTQFDTGTPPSLSFHGSRPDLEESAFVEDLIHAGNWTANAGLRYDHYQLLLNEDAFSPRLSVARYFPAAALMLHASFDRIFQTPSFENILISGSPQIDALDSSFLRLPVRPSRGNYYEGGATQALSSRARLDVNIYRRNVKNYADDDQLLNTGVSYPIAFDHAIICGAEGKLDLVRLGKLSGYVSYSYMVGNAWFPVTGGLFLGDDATSAVTQLSGHFPDSQDQRNTLRTRFRYQVAPRFWVASGASFGSGLPFEFTGDRSEALAEYGEQVANRLNFARGRIMPVLSVNATAAAEMYKGDHLSITLQGDGDNLNNRLNVIDFGGLFSGNAIGPKRSYALRLRTSF